jgi:hypothetical protein
VLTSCEQAREPCNLTLMHCSLLLSCCLMRHCSTQRTARDSSKQTAGAKRCTAGVLQLQLQPFALQVVELCTLTSEQFDIPSSYSSTLYSVCVSLCNGLTCCTATALLTLTRHCCLMCLHTACTRRAQRASEHAHQSEQRGQQLLLREAE